MYLRTIEELDQLKESHDPYDLIRISDLVYRLLYDRPSLTELSSKVLGQRFKTVFIVGAEISLPKGIPAPIFYSVEDGLDPDTSPPWSESRQINIDEFYKMEIMQINGISITVRDLIRFLRNVRGGVHRGSPDNTKEKEVAMHDMQQFFGIGGLPAGIRIMRAIGRVTLKSLRPLTEELKRLPHTEH